MRARNNTTNECSSHTIISKPAGEEGRAPASNDAPLLETAPPFNPTAEVSPPPTPSPPTLASIDAAITTAPPRRLLPVAVELKDGRARV